MHYVLSILVHYDADKAKNNVSLVHLSSPIERNSKQTLINVDQLRKKQIFKIFVQLVSSVCSVIVDVGS